MRFNSVRSSDYSQSARAVSKASDQIFDAAISGKPDFTKISQEAIKGRSLERRTATEAEGRVAQAGIKAASQVRRNKMKADATTEVEAIKRPARRMAGVVGALGTLSGAYVMKQGMDRQEERDAERDRESKAWQEEMLTAMSRPTEKPPEYPKPPVLELPDLERPGTGASTGAGSSGGGGSNSGASTYNGKRTTVSQSYMKQLLIDQGMDDHNATIGAAIGMGESSGDTGALNPNNEHSVGLWQHNRDTGEDRHAFYGISDWSELNDPVVNARATYRLWKRQGGWTPWGAYTNGSYKKYL